MAGIGSYIEHRPGNLFYTIHSDILDLLCKDEIGAAFLDVLDFRSRGELARTMDSKQQLPDEWPDDIWVQQEMSGLAAQWMLGATSAKSIQTRIEWLESAGLITTRQPHYGATREYRLNVKALNQMLKSKSRIVPFRTFQLSSGNFTGPDSSGKTSGGISGAFTGAEAPYKILGTNEVKEENKNTLPTLSEKPSEENPQDPEPEPPTCPTLDNEDLAMPLERFVHITMRNTGRMKPPNLKSRASQNVVERLLKAEEEWGVGDFRSALVSYCEHERGQEEHPKWPIQYFLSHVEKYIPDPDKTPQCEADPRPSAREVVEAVRQGAAPVPIVPAVSGSRLTAGDCTDIWNHTVVSRLYDEPKFPRCPNAPRDLWEKACVEAERLIQIDPVKFSYVTLRWATKTSEDSGDNWRRLVNREFDCMAVADKKYETKASRESKVAEGGLAILMAEFAKKGK